MHHLTKRITMSLRKNLISGFSVSLLALPLCLGIAVASHFPPIAGVMTAIVGGFIASFTGSSPFTIKGPAAGMIVVILAATLELGYEKTLAVGVASSVLQILIALFRKASIAEKIPGSVIHGMLAAVGLIIVIKQFYVLMGVHHLRGSIPYLITHIPHAIREMNPLIFAIGSTALILNLTWKNLAIAKYIPATLLILVSIISATYFFGLNNDFTYKFAGNVYMITPADYIDLPSNILSALTFPDFSALFTLISLKHVIIFTLVGATESLLTVCAVNSIKSKEPPSDLNADLRSLGLANLVSSFIGGMPMISEVVRTRANIDYGATSSLSNFIHGLILVMVVVLIPDSMDYTALTALAAILIVVGLRLGSPTEFIDHYKQGWAVFIPFIGTVTITLCVDLLSGVVCGLMLHFLIKIQQTLRRKQIPRT